MRKVESRKRRNAASRRCTHTRDVADTLKNHDEAKRLCRPAAQTTILAEIIIGIYVTCKCEKNH